MDSKIAKQTPAPNSFERLLTIVLATMTALLALTLASTQFQTKLDSDLLWPQVFAHDLGDPLHPVSGWRFGSATFWFPDFALFLPLYWLCGDSGFNYVLYPVAFYLLLGMAMAWALVETGVARARAATMAFLTLTLLLLCQFIPGHALGLWLIGIPVFHGGNLLNGFLLLALGLGAVRTGQWSRPRSIAAVTIMTLGLMSDALLLFHWIIPLLLVLAWQMRRTKALKPVFTGLALRATLAIGLVVVARVLMAATGWFLYYRLARDWPLPALIGQTLSQFFADLTQHGLFSHQWLFVLLAMAAFLLVARWRHVEKIKTGNQTADIAIYTGGLGLALAWAIPMVTIYWHDVNSLRYLLNWLVVPAWMLALWLGQQPNFHRLLLPLSLTAGTLGAALGLTQLGVDKMVFSCPPEAQALREYCAKNNLREGLSGYWLEHYLRVLWNFGGPRLSPIREKDFSYFWCSNAFDYFPTAPGGHGLLPPAPQFVIMNGLDRAQVAKWLGDEPLRVEMVGPYEIARLSPGQMRRAAELILLQSREILAGRRARWLETKLPLLP